MLMVVRSIIMFELLNKLDEYNKNNNTATCFFLIQILVEKAFLYPIYNNLINWTCYL